MGFPSPKEVEMLLSVAACPDEGVYMAVVHLLYVDLSAEVHEHSNLVIVY